MVGNPGEFAIETVVGERHRRYAAGLKRFIITG
jgi:hypothetical protein